MIGVGLRKTGNWRKAQMQFTEFKEAFRRASKKGLQELTEHCKQTIIGHIEKQSLPFKKLSDRYIAFKAKRGLDSRVYVSTGAFKGHILRKTLSHKRAKVYVRDGAKTAKGISYSLVAAVLENGSQVRNIPARPLWSPSAKEAMEWAKAQNLFQEKLKSELQ